MGFHTNTRRRSTSHRTIERRQYQVLGTQHAPSQRTCPIWTARSCSTVAEVAIHRRRVFACAMSAALPISLPFSASDMIHPRLAHLLDSMTAHHRGWRPLLDPAPWEGHDFSAAEQRVRFPSSSSPASTFSTKTFLVIGSDPCADYPKNTNSPAHRHAGCRAQGTIAAISGPTVSQDQVGHFHSLILSHATCGPHSSETVLLQSKTTSDG